MRGNVSCEKTAVAPPERANLEGEMAKNAVFLAVFRGLEIRTAVANLRLAGDARVRFPLVDGGAFGAALVAIDDARVVEAEQIHDRGVQVVDVQAV